MMKVDVQQINYISQITPFHLCFNITEKGKMIVLDGYNRILEYTKKYYNNYSFQW